MSAIFIFQLYMALSVTKIIARDTGTILMLRNHVIRTLPRLIFDTSY